MYNMKTGFFFVIAALSLLQLAASQPHGHQHQHRKHNLVWVTEVEYTTVEAANVVIYVDQKGNPISTTTIIDNQATPTQVQVSSPLSKNKAPSSASSPQSSKQQSCSTPQPQPATPASQPPPPPPVSTPISVPVPSAEPAKPVQAPEPVKPVHSVQPPQPSKAAEPVLQPSPAPVPPPVYQEPAPKPSQDPPAEPAPAESTPAKSTPAESTPAEPTSAEPAPTKPAPTKPAPVDPAPVGPAPGGSGGPDFNSGVSYSPYNADNSCKSTSQVANDFQAIRGYSVIRLYGTDCNQIANVIEAIQGKGISLFLGIFDITQLHDECQTIIDAVNGDWSLINAVSVGNELVNRGGASVGEVTTAIGQVRDTLKGAGYGGPVVTVDTMVAIKDNPELCHASDFCAINCHAFFDGNVLPDGAGDFVQLWADMVSEAANGKTVVVTETGWPTQGEANHKAVPSKENQAAAIESIRLKLGKNVIVFNAFNDLWKVDRGDTFGAERFWGVFGDAPSNAG